MFSTNKKPILLMYEAPKYQWTDIRNFILQSTDPTSLSTRLEGNERI